jgi:hypothetical protein
MQKEIAAFIGRAKELSDNNGLSSGIVGSTKRQSVMTDLYKEAIELREADSSAKIEEHLENIVGVLHVAQAMNVIGFEDLEELMDMLETIKSEEK